MSARTSNVRSILDEWTGRTNESNGSASLTQADVREAVDQALDDRENGTGDRTDAVENETGDESSRRGRSLKGLLALGVLASLSYFVRRRRRGTGEDDVSEAN